MVCVPILPAASSLGRGSHRVPGQHSVPSLSPRTAPVLPEARRRREGCTNPLFTGHTIRVSRPLLPRNGCLPAWVWAACSSSQLDAGCGAGKVLGACRFRAVGLLKGAAGSAAPQSLHLTPRGFLILTSGPVLSHSPTSHGFSPSLAAAPSSQMVLMTSGLGDSLLAETEM